MEDKYQNKYRISSSRLAAWDYGSHGLYFITICTKNRIRYFGEIENDIQNNEGNTASLQVTDIGKIAYDNWLRIPTYHPYVEVDEFVIMPDHMHGILFINKPDKMTWEINKFGAQRNNLASIVRGYKSSVKQYANINNLEFYWQPGYYDRVIRSEKEHRNVIQHIFNNPDNWLLGGNSFENLFTT
ncbi:MAG: transposase [Sphingobacteriales bacterium]